MDEREVIKRFVARYSECQKGQYQITRWPEDGGGSEEIDGYAEATDAPPLALEHTLVETVQNQKLDSARFLQVIGPLESQLRNKFPGYVALAIPMFSIQPGQDWGEIADQLRLWILDNIPNLPQGIHNFNDIEGIPFRFSISKHDSPQDNFFIERFAPTELNLVEKMINAINRKKDKLHKYERAGAKPILILESDDIALVSRASLYVAFLQANQQVSHKINDIWMAETFEGLSPSENSCELYCFLGSEEMMNTANPENSMFHPRHQEYWWDHIRQEQEE